MSHANYLSEDTIAAVATALGGPIAVVRVSGPKAKQVFGALTNQADRLEKEPNRLRRVALQDSTGKPLDDAMAVFFARPNSFTGEDLFELHIHGGPFLVSRVMETLLGLGARRALPGEFSFRAVRNGKMTLTQAEAVHDLVQATNSRATELALEKVIGQHSRWVEELSEETQQLVAMSELGIDFADQDVEEVSLPALKKRAEQLKERLEEIAKSYSRGRKIQDGFRAVILGLPNTGKSSLFNAFLGEERSIVTAVAGTTRDVVHETLTLRGASGEVTLRLEDTAGLRAATDLIEKEGIERTRTAARTADVLIWLVALDAQTASEAADIQKVIAAEWETLGRPKERSVILFTKSDAQTDLGRKTVTALSKAFGVTGVGETSSVTGQGVIEAGRALADFLSQQVQRSPGEVLLTRLEHAQQVSAAIEHLKRAQVTEHNDLFAADLRLALSSLAPLIGISLPDDILGRIFSKFCIGK